eukprot:7102562-Prymnesium_polylepis.1
MRSAAATASRGLTFGEDVNVFVVDRHPHERAHHLRLGAIARAARREHLGKVAEAVASIHLSSDARRRES